MKKTFRLFVAFFLFFVSVSGVVAADTTECTTTTGSYGQTSTTCKVLGVTHEPVKAGLADVSFLLVAEILAVVGLGTFGLAKLAERTYWFD